MLAIETRRPAGHALRRLLPPTLLASLLLTVTLLGGVGCKEHVTGVLIDRSLEVAESAVDSVIYRINNDIRDAIYDATLIPAASTSTSASDLPASTVVPSNADVSGGLVIAP